ncbi:mannose-1-phosphate guanylyltransferase [Flagellimonas allohymeniacidonis]|uniref:mannose-1-phosphate guanylyltransferase n=1 Tax=Flagellimonas allohymeniacidonis TaxID=2517819 RepID=A0A4Q8QK55_9FLAO|nr:mannose-1-phosphate guanylyltransferase [Allomuricauda hymeniacidonis]TAI49728.1 mannose-1-phosphate guanylyltransferase [Allomuricauda hymeniacidonis]
MNKNYYAVLMAGGVGSRFWPVSTSSYPKQFHDMLGSGKTLIQKTFDRLNKFIPSENILILTNERYNDLVLEQLPLVKQNQVVLEPAMRNTSPCILYASLKIQKMNPNAVIVVAPSDHWIEDEQAFEQDVKACFDKCTSESVLCTLGIRPTFPNTGFGYIEYEKESDAQLKKVSQFREKPDYETAREFLEQGNFLWNAGIFMWSVETIVNAFKTYQPSQYELFEQGIACYNTSDEATFIQENYAKAENISIDYAILEQSQSIFTLPATFDWNDLGTWGALYEKLDKDDNKNAVVNSRILLNNAKGNMIRTAKDKIVVVDGLEDYIIVDKEEVLLIYPKSKQQDIKKVLGEVKEQFGEQYT